MGPTGQYLYATDWARGGASRNMESNLAVSGAKHETSFRSDQAGLQHAENAANGEKDMGFRETFKIYRKAMMWSMILSTALIMEGYDVVIVSDSINWSDIRSTAFSDISHSWRLLAACPQREDFTFPPTGNRQ